VNRSIKPTTRLLPPRMAVQGGAPVSQTHNLAVRVAKLLREQRALVRAVVVFLVIVAGLAPVSTLAQEPGEEVVRAKTGPYDITVVTNQAAPNSGNVAFIVDVVEEAAQAPVSDAQVRIRTRNEADGTEAYAIALNTPRAPGRYVAKEVVLSNSGTWDISVDVSSPLGEVTVALPSVEVRITSGSPSGSFVFSAASLAILLGALYLWRSSRRALRRRAAAQSSEDARQAVGDEGRS